MPYTNKADQNACQRRWYERNKEQHKALVYARRKITQKETRDWLHSYKSTSGCKDCGETHPAALDFHHRDPKEKKFLISEALRRYRSLARIQEEIAKCDVLCANCHRKLHRSHQKLSCGGRIRTDDLLVMSQTS